MKIRILKLTPENLAALLQGKTSALPNLPSDLEILDIKLDLFSKQVSMVVRSESFEDVAENNTVPELVPKKNASTHAASAPAKSISTPLLPQPQAPPEIKPASAKLIQPQPSRYAAKMENEFSPEQRKLLSFTVKEDCVVVKPVVFLKAEWDDINEVVRSLGGRWVKGDIISYWEIPLG